MAHNKCETSTSFFPTFFSNFFRFAFNSTPLCMLFSLPLRRLFLIFCARPTSTANAKQHFCADATSCSVFALHCIRNSCIHFWKLLSLILSATAFLAAFVWWSTLSKNYSSRIDCWAACTPSTIIVWIWDYRISNRSVGRSVGRPVYVYLCSKFGMVWHGMELSFGSVKCTMHIFEESAVFVGYLSFVFDFREYVRCALF